MQQRLDVATWSGQVKPILGPMLLDEARVVTATEQMTLATWATKTMLAMGGVNLHQERVVNADQYRWFERYRMPLPNSHVWLCRYHRQGEPDHLGTPVRDDRWPGRRPEPAPGRSDERVWRGLYRGSGRVLAVRVRPAGLAADLGRGLMTHTS